MSETVVLWLNGKSYSKQNIIRKEYSANTNFEKSTLSFCHDWLTGKMLFEIQTSGSTGTPKKITFTRAQLEASARLTEKALLLKKGSNALVCLDTQYIAGQMMLVRSFVTGMNIFAVEPSANPFASLPPEIKIDFAALVPYQVQAVLESTLAETFNKANTIIIGGAAASDQLIEQLQSYSCQFFATYGMTETISHIALRKVNGNNKQTHFHPIESVHINKDERECLVIHAPHISNESIITNDLVEINDDQSFQIIGRWDNIINTGGVKISPEAVEEKIRKIFHQLQLANRFFIAPMKDERLGNKIVLIVEGQRISEYDYQKLSDELRKSLNRFEIPKEILFIKSFVETATQKINRQKTTDILLSSEHL